ncbi:MAG TPA: histidine phosphatase family protein [Chryseosolibacter sp.]
MAKHLFLYRHAEAAQAHSSDGDRDRELTAKGISQSNQIGTYLFANNFNVKHIFTSPALRAHQTAAITAEAMKFNTSDIVIEEELYTATTRTFFEFVSKLDSVLTSVMCVGHNPTITYLAEYFTKESIGDLVPAGLVIIKFDINTWAEISQGNGQLVKYILPESIEK